jgi:hypothetical protein
VAVTVTGRSGRAQLFQQYPLQATDTDTMRPSPDVASERSLECPSEPPARLQDNCPIVTLFQHPEIQPMALYPGDNRLL